MITKEQAMTHYEFFHMTLKNRDGTPIRCRASGRCKTWKTRPDEFQLPVKYGLRDCFYITQRNAHEWTIVDIRYETPTKEQMDVCRNKK